ncbi:hypothetical protein OO006_03820 [Prosthecochloris sp. SCSIO W1101]|nr:hypothetical protein [Prosthecochloris sp. SCSIO W1101]UZJ42119.1 hypothetical protein OO006_03820 [Prosthecochloris sp. SCSIO W1101]
MNYLCRSISFAGLVIAVFIFTALDGGGRFDFGPFYGLTEYAFF